MRSIINILDLSAGEIDQLIAVADDIMAQPEKDVYKRQPKLGTEVGDYPIHAV